MNIWCCIKLLSWSSLEPLISLDLVTTKLYCFEAGVHCYYCFYIIFSANLVKRSQELHQECYFFCRCHFPHYSKKRHKSNDACSSQINFDLLPASGFWTRQIVSAVHVSMTKKYEREFTQVINSFNKIRVRTIRQHRQNETLVGSDNEWLSVCGFRAYCCSAQRLKDDWWSIGQKW